MRLCAFADEASVDLAGQIAALKRNNISLLEIRGVDGENIKDISYEKIKEIGKALEGNGIGVWSIGSPIGKDKTDNNFAKQLDDFKRLCEYAEMLGAKRMRMFSFFSKDEGAVMDCLGRFCDVAPKSIIMCHENEKGIFGDDFESCAKIHKAFPQIKAVFDPANFVQCDVDTLRAWETLSPYINYMHIKDALADKSVVPAGCGIGNVKELIKKYRAQGGEVMTLEPHLMEFCGLKGLENGESLNHKPVFTDTNEAFDAGVKALKELLEQIGERV
ncbi:MAG: sugar phosphate isomerase/epimerase [Clostridia bacterium]|nr:sugar phosphate isomerase/epimerase [Clostridia bacterium]